ncbi:MAG: DegT/DnrJ/EryC1/StrS family aminotransferase [Leptospiraceae bacterium]|nr:DegT/DnrJ/EryC1/StrS family aminotransferase [Leptospiraceae bacterium]MCP5503023.1 DegT/DnrJ/EryC1/StrS family aminotransferase [Leptospiraceae bacterium]
MGVPFIDIKRYENGFLDKWNHKVAEMSQNAAFIGGIEVQELEKELSAYAETRYCVSCANGTDALQLALRAVGVGAGDKVLLPDSTFWATFESVVNVSAEPYTVDINKEDLQMDFETFAKAVEEIKPKAAILVHLYGWASKDLQKFRELCTSKNIPLIEDGAQSFGVKVGSESIYKNAHIATTSFYPAKVLGAAGDAGAVFTNDESLANTVRTLANHGRTTHYGHGLVGWNSRLDSLQAAFLRISLKEFPERLKSRQYWAKKYQEELPKLGIRVLSPPEGIEENGYCNACLFSPEERTRLQDLLKEKGIGSGVIYPGAMSAQPGAKDFCKKSFDKGVTKEICSSILNLPLFPYMREDEFQEVITTLKEFKA